MGLQTAFGILSEIVDKYESRGRTVRHVEATATDTDDGSLNVSLEVPVSLCAASGEDVHTDLTPKTATLTNGGGLQVEFSSSALASLPPTTAASISKSEEAVHVEDGSIVLGVELTIDPTEETTVDVRDAEASVEASQATDTPKDEQTGDGADHTASPTARSGRDAEQTQEERDELAAVRDEDVPAYEDTTYLQHLYEACENFTEMSERIEMDVSSETVRRYMIEADVHDPTSYDTSNGVETTDADTEASPSSTATDADPTVTATNEDPMETIPDEQLVTDGLGLPENVQLEDIADAVVDSVTVYEVQRHLDLGRQQTQELLEELNLLDLVMRQLSADSEQTVSYDRVATRIRECTPRSA